MAVLEVPSFQTSGQLHLDYRFLVASVFPGSGVDVTASWTELWWLGNPVPGSYQGLSCLSLSG